MKNPLFLLATEVTYNKKPKPKHRTRTITVHVRGTGKRKGYTATRKDLGKAGVGPKLIPIGEKGSLKKLGYSTKKGDAARHGALNKAVQKYGALTVFHKIQSQIILRKRTQPQVRKVFEEDRDWLKKTFMS